MTNRRQFLVKFTMAAGAVTFLKPLNALAEGSVPFPVILTRNKLTILHTANLKGQWYALRKNEKLSGYGGLLNVRKKIEDIRREGAPVILLDSGNMTDACVQANEERLLFYKSMQAMRYDAVIPGEADLSAGASCFTKLVNESRLQAISLPQYLLFRTEVFPCRVVKKGIQNIGIIHVPAFSGLTDHSLSDIAATLSRTARQLKEVNECTLVVCLIQTNKERNLHLAMLSSHVDVICCAAEGTSIYNTEIIRNKMGHEVVLSFAGLKGAMVSRIDFKFNNRNEKVSMTSKAIFTGAKEEDVAAILRRYDNSLI